MITEQIRPKIGQNIDKLVERWKAILTQEIPKGVVPKVAENTRRIALTKGASIVEILIGD